MKKKLIKILLPLTLLFACFGVVACNRLPEKLSAPENLRVEGGILYWDKVEYADGYSVLIGEKEYLTNENNYDLSDLDEMAIHSIEILAYSDRGIARSENVHFKFAGRFALPTKGLEFQIVSALSGYATVRVSKLAVDSNGVCVIPATYQGYKVTEFNSIDKPAAPADGAPPLTALVPQAVCAQIKCLYLPYAVAARYNSYWAFSNLQEIVVGDSESGETRYVSEGNCVIDKVSNRVVVGCVNSVIPDYVTTIGANAFAGRKNITSFIIPEQITKIDVDAFNECSSLTELTILGKIDNLKEAFVNCTSLKEVRFSEGIKSMIRTFEGCSSLRSVIIPESATEYYAFSDCTSLKSVVLPKNPRIQNSYIIKLFGRDDNALIFYAFKNCPLEEVYFRDTRQEWEGGTGYIEEGNTELFAATWYYYSETAPTEAGNYWRYVNGVPTKWNTAT